MEMADIEGAAFFQEMERKKEETVSMLKRLNMSYDELLGFAAVTMNAQSELIEQNDELISLLKDRDEALLVFSGRLEKSVEGARLFMLEVMAGMKNTTAKALLKGVELQKSSQAKKGAKVKLARDPKQSEKNLIHECWLNWQKNPDSYRSKAAFARDMLEKCEHLTSQKKIEDWCRKWEKVTRNHAG